MELETISNDEWQFIYVGGHIDLVEFGAAVLVEGYDICSDPEHTWMVEGEIPEWLVDDYDGWYEFCDADVPGAFPVTGVKV